jgi:hypothetical protein
VNDDDLVWWVVDDLRRLARRPSKNWAELSSLVHVADLAPSVDMTVYGYDREELGEQVRVFLKECLDSFNQPVWCYVRELEPDEYRAAMRLALGQFVSTMACSPYNRRMQTKLYLQMPYEYETWRKYEVVLFEALASHIVKYAKTRKGGRIPIHMGSQALHGMKK